MLIRLVSDPLTILSMFMYICDNACVRLSLALDKKLGLLRLNTMRKLVANMKH